MGLGDGSSLMCFVLFCRRKTGESLLACYFMLYSTAHTNTGLHATYNYIFHPVEITRHVD